MSEVNITPPAALETDEQIQAMVDKAEGKATPPIEPTGEPERPAWLPDKFATPEAMAEAYAAMEKKQSGPKETPAGEPTVVEEEASEAANAAVEGAGLNMDELGTKIVNNGDIDAADYAALAKQGISKEMVQSYVQGQQALGERLVSDMHQTVGGEEAFNGLLEWGAENMAPDEVEAFNQTIDSGSPAAVKMALQGLQARAQAEGGKAPSLLGGNRPGSASGDVFRSTAEVTKAMSDPRYQRDAAYRADVMAKLGRSNVM